MAEKENKQGDKFDKFACVVAQSSGTPTSLIIHTVFFVGIFALYFFGVDFDTVLLILTTILSVEAIYLHIFTQLIQNKIAEQSPDIDI